MLGLVLAVGMVGQCSGHAYLTIPQARGDAGTSPHQRASCTLTQVDPSYCKHPVMVPLLPYPNLCAHSHLIAHTHARTPTPSHIPALYPARIDLRASSLNPTSSLSATTPDRTRTRFTPLPSPLQPYNHPSPHRGGPAAGRLQQGPHCVPVQLRQGRQLPVREDART